jgi:tRNA G18 (ribose-2'-O)-methylase SpoU
MHIERIDDFEDSRVADYRNLRDRQLVAGGGRFVVEGRLNLRVMLERSPFTPDSILLADRAHRAMAEELARLAPDCPVYVAEQAVVDRVAGFPIHRGSLAIGTRGPSRDPMTLVRELLAAEPAPRVVVLERVSDPDNLGGIFRNAMALGGRAVFLCPQTVDALYRKAIRTSMGASLIVPFARTADLGSLLDGLKAAGFDVLALDPAEGGSDIADIATRKIGPVALLLGTEGEGLSEAALARADHRVRIAMEPGVDSVNVSVAAGIALHRLRIPASR